MLTYPLTPEILQLIFCKLRCSFRNRCRFIKSLTSFGPELIQEEGHVLAELLTLGLHLLKGSACNHVNLVFLGFTF